MRAIQQNTTNTQYNPCLLAQNHYNIRKHESKMGRKNNRHQQGAPKPHDSNFNTFFDLSRNTSGTVEAVSSLMTHHTSLKLDLSLKAIHFLNKISQNQVF